MTSPAVRAAVYTVFAARWIARWMIGAALAFAALCLVYVAGVCVYYAEPWYDHDVTCSVPTVSPAMQPKSRPKQTTLGGRCEPHVPLRAESSTVELSVIAPSTRPAAGRAPITSLSDPRIVG